jgi:hypothetical protein
MNPQRAKTPRDIANSRRPTSDPLSDEKMKARAIQRWENEGGRTLPKAKSTEDARKKQPR